MVCETFRLLYASLHINFWLQGSLEVKRKKQFPSDLINFSETLCLKRFSDTLESFNFDLRGYIDLNLSNLSRTLSEHQFTSFLAHRNSFRRVKVPNNIKVPLHLSHPVPQPTIGWWIFSFFLLSFMNTSLRWLFYYY